MSRDVPAGASQLWARVSLVAEDGALAIGVDPSEVQLFYQVQGSAPVGPLDLVASGDPVYADEKWYEQGGGSYLAGLPVALAETAEDVIDVFGTYANGDLHGETLRIVSAGVTLTGPNVLTVTVKSSASGEGIEGARVRAYKNGVGQSKLTNGSGVATWTVEDGETWAIDAEHPLFSGQTRTGISISGGTHAEEFELDPYVIPASEAGEVTLYVHALRVNDDGDGYEDAGAGIVVHVQVTDGDVPGFVIPGEVLEAITDADSKAYFTGIPWSVRFAAWEGDSVRKKKHDRTPDSGTTHPVPLIVGEA